MTAFCKNHPTSFLGKDQFGNWYETCGTGKKHNERCEIVVEGGDSMSDFLPNDYEVPSSGGNYMKFEQGDNKLRILSTPIMGWEYWEDRKPLRRHMNNPFSTIEVENPEDVKHFWAMVVYNYQSEKVQVLEITQKGIQKTLKALAGDEDWGSPVQTYDIVVNKTGEKMETKYAVLPKPAKPMDKGILKAYEDMQINLAALYEGEDPFQSNESEDIANSAVAAGL